jgi:hypothetical protein
VFSGDEVVKSITSVARKAFVVLALLTPCLLSSTMADASPVRKARVRPHRITARRAISPTQAFARLASRRPDRRVYRHPPTWLKKGHGNPQSDDHDAAIQNTVFPENPEAPHEAPVLRPLALLVPVQAQIQSHDGFAQSSPRAPPALS